MSTALPGLEVDALSFAFRGAGGRLDDISFSVAAGELCCLLGPNGAGKTTLLRCLLRQLRPDRGVVRVLGDDVSRRSLRAAARQVAYVPQQVSTPFAFTALEVAVMGRTPHVGAVAAPSAADRRAALRELDRLGVGHLADRPFALLSGGEQQLTLLARALVQEAPVLILDEPTASLDYGNEARFLDLAAALAASGRSILMTTHQPAHAFGYADHVVLLRRGRLLADGAPDVVLTSEQLSDLYGVPVHVAEITGPDGVTRRTCVPVRPSTTLSRR